MATVATLAGVFAVWVAVAAFSAVPVAAALLDDAPVVGHADFFGVAGGAAVALADVCAVAGAVIFFGVATEGAAVFAACGDTVFAVLGVAGVGFAATLGAGAATLAGLAMDVVAVTGLAGAGDGAGVAVAAAAFFCFAAGCGFAVDVAGCGFSAGDVGCESAAVVGAALKPAFASAGGDFGSRASAQLGRPAGARFQ